MRNAFQLTVLFLFLLVPALITRAQKVSVSGNVYEKGTVKNKFTTPHGSITTILPDDIRPGDQITGTVIYEPEGRREKDKNKNRVELLKYSLSLEPTRNQGSASAEALKDVFILQNKPQAAAHGGAEHARDIFVTELNIPPGIATDLSWILRDFGKNIVAESSQAIMYVTIPDFSQYTVRGRSWGDNPVNVSQPQQPARIFVPEKTIYMAGEQVLIQYSSASPKPKSGSMAYLNRTRQKELSAAQPLELQTLTSSPRQSVLIIPGNIYGPGELVWRGVDGNTIASEKIHVLQLEASCPKTNLGKGESTVLTVQVKGLEDCPAEFLRLSLDNTTSNSVKLGKSNHEDLFIDPQAMSFSSRRRDFEVIGDLEMENISIKNPDLSAEPVLTLQRSVTALQAGNFNIDITLNYPSSVFNDPFKQQLDALKTITQFNDWQEALKADLRFVDNEPSMPGDVHANLQKSVPELNALKSVAYSYLRSMRIGSSSQLFVRSTIETGRAALQNVITEQGTQPIHYEVIHSALQSAGQQALLMNNGYWKDIMDSLRSKLMQIQREAQRMTEALRAYQEILKGLDEVKKWIMQNMRASVDPQPAKADSTDALTDGLLVIRYLFSHIQEISFPEMDARNKEQGQMMSVYYPRKGSIANSPPAQKNWNVNNFRFEMDGLPCKGITKLESFKIEAKVPKTDKYSHTIYPYIEFKIPFEEIKSWQEWLNNKSPRNGTLQYTDEKSGVSTTIELKNVRPVSALNEPGYGMAFRIIPENAFLNFSPEIQANLILTISQSPLDSPGDVADNPFKSWGTLQKDLKQFEIVPKNRVMNDSPGILSSLISRADPGWVPRPEDLVAVFNPQSKKLVYDPQYKDQVFAKFQPRLRTDGRYDVQVMSMSRKPMQITIDLIPGSLFDLINQSKDSIKYDKYGFESTGEMITEKWDSTGAGYRFYKNAKCKQWFEGSETTCTAVEEKDSTGKWVPTGKYRKSVRSKLSHCYKGTEFCTEMYVIDLVEYFYDDANCKRLIKVKTWNSWTCE